ncbi:hypothetical protein NDU88_004388 [Pleurodeles waltl]|uniref:Uncharacterized protein n=1 Tax=Pleurodeles waltl TaxID=8319 RepID=A0AAV7VK46_PLEWA|nr:hypothetical protein NDU88_004388 [Pleurodeles waltl]
MLLEPAESPGLRHGDWAELRRQPDRSRTASANDGAARGEAILELAVLTLCPELRRRCEDTTACPDGRGGYQKISDGLPCMRELGLRLRNPPAPTVEYSSGSGPGMY